MKIFISYWVEVVPRNSFSGIYKTYFRNLFYEVENINEDTINYIQNMIKDTEQTKYPYDKIENIIILNIIEVKNEKN